MLPQLNQRLYTVLGFGSLFIPVPDNLPQFPVSTMWYFKVHLKDSYDMLQHAVWLQSDI